MSFRNWFKGAKAKAMVVLGGFAVLLGVGASVYSVAAAKQTEVVETKADYSGTIRVYVDLTWDNIDYVRLDHKEAADNAVLSSSDSKYNQSLGKYVRDISSSSTYDKMGFFFSQSGQWWQYQYDGGYVWIAGGFKPGYEYQLKSIGYVSESGGIKYFACAPYEIGEITDNISNPTVYFVDGHSWGSGNVYVHYWGGTASSTYPGSAMSGTSMTLRCYVGDTEYPIKIYKFTISGSCAYVQFNNNSDKTGDLRVENRGVYWYGVDANEYSPITSFLLSLTDSMGTWKGKSSSICAMNQTKAQSLVDTYDGIMTDGSARQRSSIAGSTINTYDPGDTSRTREVAISEIYTELKYKAENGTWSAHVVPGLEDNSQSPLTLTLWIVLGTGVLGLGAIGVAYLVSKKKKRSQA